MKRISIILSVIVLFILPFSMGFKNPFIEPDYWFLYITNHFEEYILKNPQQKVYLHLDRDEYVTGATIWYKAYVLDDTKKLPDVRSRNLYVELISPTKQAIMHRLLKVENGVAWGDFPVQDSIGTGLYLIRAYTNNMQNYGKEYLFSKEISIINPLKVYYSKDFRRIAKKVKKQSVDFDLQFFPEGGYLIDNIKTKLAFKAISQNGLGVDFEGKIYSKNGSIVSEIKSSHLGMGYVDFTPLKDEKYTAIVNTDNKKKWKFELPKVLLQGYVLNVSDNGDFFSVSIQTNKLASADPVSNSAYLFVQNGGTIYYKKKLTFEEKKVNLELEKKDFPSGIIHFTLFDGHGKPYCERIAFVNQHNNLNISANFESKNVGKRNKIEFDVLVTDSKGEPVSADLSLSVKNKTQETGIVSNSVNIKNYMLLQSDLKGNIEDPEYYFENDSKHQKDLDILMLTQGWRKFIWKDILRDTIPYPHYQMENDLRITGRITKYFFNIPVHKAKVTLTMLNQFNDIFRTKSGKKGEFEFTGLNYYDTLDILVEVETNFGRKNVLILVDEQESLGNDFFPYKAFYLDSLLIKRKIKYEKWKEPQPDPSKPEEFKIYQQADQVVKFDSPSYSSYSNVMDALKGRVAGLTVGNNGSMIRGPNSILGDNNPLYLIDGVQTDYNGIQSVSVNDIDHVDILKGPSAAIYGIQGANGVIAVYTKRGFFYKRGEIRFKMLGYHIPKEFYSPKYQSKNIDWSAQDLRKTAYWKPNIKTNKEGKAHIIFYQSDIVDQFEMVFEGMSKNGQVGVYKYDYQVQEIN